ncbi:MAG: hypothetical protein IJY16_04420 [Clostridia bacterium]|nr:hypothetical protein [Clostridia bacterium]
MGNEHKENGTVAALKKEMEALRASYEEQLAALQAKRQEETQQDEKEERRERFMKAEEAYLNEYVEVKLFRDNEKYKDDVYVAINGKNCIIRRGVGTRIRRKFALLLDQSEIQDLRTAELMDREAGRFADESRRRSM